MSRRDGKYSWRITMVPKTAPRHRRSTRSNRPPRRWCSTLPTPSLPSTPSATRPGPRRPSSRPTRSRRPASQPARLRRPRTRRARAGRIRHVRAFEREPIARAKVAALEQQAHALNAQFQLKAQQLRSSESRAAQLDDRVSALSANKTVPADAPAQLRQIVGAIPPATDGLRQCAADALQTASNALDVAVNRASSVARLNASATSVATACQRAGVAANRLDGLSDRAKR